MYLNSVQFVRPIACPARRPTGLLDAHINVSQPATSTIWTQTRHLTLLHLRCSPPWKRLTPNVSLGVIGCLTACVPSCGHMRVLLLEIQSLWQMYMSRAMLLYTNREYTAG